MNIDNIPNRAGAYIIQNTLNGKCYIGSSKYLRKRINEHFLRLGRNNHHANHLQMAWNKYGGENFLVSILCYCDPANCTMFEQLFMDALHPEYNVLPRANSRMGSHRTAETRRKISQATKGKVLSDETKSKIALASRIRPVKDSTRDKIKAIKSDISVITRQKLREATSREWNKRKSSSDEEWQLIHQRMSMAAKKAWETRRRKTRATQNLSKEIVDDLPASSLRADKESPSGRKKGEQLGKL